MEKETWKPVRCYEGLYEELARRFGVSKTSICFIQSGRNWPHVK